jgi:hypothetical protein
VELLRHPDPRHLVVSYNRWASDAGYRAQLSSALMGSRDDSTIRVTSRFGGGSSFYLEPITARTFARKWPLLLNPRTIMRIPQFWPRLPGSRQRRYFVRWKLYRRDDEYRRLFRDTELVDLSERLFGEIRGTRAFVRRL